MSLLTYLLTVHLAIISFNYCKFFPMANKCALISGITGQDGAYLAKLLLDNGYQVIGSSRDPLSSNTFNLERLSIRNEIDLISLTPNDLGSVLKALSRIQPTEIYNLSGLTSVSYSFEQPFEAFHSIAIATTNYLEAIRQTDPSIKFFNAGSSECFGTISTDDVSREGSPFKPNSPYAVAKAASYWTVDNYRRSYGLYCCTGILGNHESPLRPERFVTQKIVNAAINIRLGRQIGLSLGNVDIWRDWGWAEDYVHAMHLMLQQKTARDYVIATGKTHSLLDFADRVFSYCGLQLNDHLIIDSQLYRPSDISYSALDPSLIFHDLGWSATVSFPEIAQLMVKYSTFGCQSAWQSAAT